jgi:nitrite reductase/ring-hydroxylating ferredoxin subunit
MADYVKVATVDQLQPDRGLMVETAGKRIAVFKLGADYFAIDDACTHVGGSLADGQIMGQNVICPWHGAQFNLATGQCTPPARGPVSRYPVRVNGSDIEVAVEIVA